MKKIMIYIARIVAAVSFFLLLAPTAHAATNGRMIDDAVFDNSGSMSAQDIQNFLNTFPNGCLKNYTDDMPSSNPVRAYFDYSGTGSAAQIIRRVADNYGINPRVLLVKLEQESSLISGGGGCQLWRQASAIGFKCFDGANPRTTTFRGSTIQTCVATDADMGVARQLSKGGWLLKWGKERANGNLSWMVPDDAAATYGGPMTQGSKKRCGSCATVYYDGYWSGVYLESGATASLYNYTPYLNQSFDNIWENWWGAGSTYGIPYRAAYLRQATYPTIQTGQSATVYFEYKNTGSMAWYDDQTAAANNAQPLHLATSQPTNRRSEFGSDWGGNQNRPANSFVTVYKADGTAYSSNPHVVQPGESMRMQFALKVPLATSPGTYREYYRPIIEGTADGAIYDPGTYMDVTVTTPTYISQYYRQSSYPSIQAGQTATGHFDFKNAGTATWYDDTNASANNALPVHLATNGPINRSSHFGSSWGGNRNRPSLTFGAVYEADGTTLAGDQHAVEPGQIGRLSFTVSAPIDLNMRRAYSMREYFRPVVEGSSNGLFDDPGTFLDVTVQPIIYASQYYRQSNYPTLSPGQSTTGYFDFKNVGNIAWYDDTSIGGAPAGALPIHLATNAPINRTSRFGATWTANRNRPSLNFGAVYEANGTTLAANQHVVQPGQIARLSFSFTVPAGTPAGMYREYFQPVVEGSSDGILDDPHTWLDVTVQ